MSVHRFPRSAVRFYAAAFLAAVCVLAGCREKRTVEIPREQPNLLMEILTGLDTGKYAAALPQIRRYQITDSTNPFLTELEAQTVTNLYFSRARAQLNAGDFAGAERTMRESAEKYEPRTERAELEQFVSLLRNADELISRLGGVMPSAELRSVAEDLKRVAKNLPGSAGVIAYAERKIREADELANLEADRRFVWLWFDAQDELRAGDVRKAGLLTALISAGRPDGDADPMVRDLMNGGMFDKN